MDPDRLARIRAYTESLPADSSRVALEDLLAEVASLSDVAQIKERSNQLSWQVTDLAAEADRYRGEVIKLRSALDGAQPSLALASQQLIDHRTRLMSAEAQRDQLRDLVQPVREDNARLTDQVAQLNAEQADLQHRHDALANHRDSLQRSLEDVTGDRNHWAGVATQRAQDVDKGLTREAVLRADADRLARWIIDHPTGPDDQRTEVLNLHDRV